MTARRSRARALIATVGLVGIVGMWPFSAAGQEPNEGPTSFLAVAAADGVRLNIQLKGYLVVEQIADVGGPTAQALVSSVDSAGYAGFPWPGSETLAVYGLGRGATGAPLPDYPLAVQSSSAKPEATAEAGVVVLKAKTEPSKSEASATGGVASGGLSTGRTVATAVAEHEPSSGTAVAEATNVAEVINVDGVLRLGAISSKSKVSATPGQEPARETSLQVSHVTIAGQSVGFTDEGFVFAGTNTPIPADNPLAKALADNGIEMTYVASEQSPDGVVSAGLRVTLVRQVPGLPEPVRIVYEFGRVSASAVGGGASPDEPGLAESAAQAVARDSATASGPPSLAQPGEASPPADPQQGSALRTVPVGAGGEQALIADLGFFYLVIALAGAFVIVGSLLVKLFGVRVLWPG